MNDTMSDMEFWFVGKVDGDKVSLHENCIWLDKNEAVLEFFNNFSKTKLVLMKYGNEGCYPIETARNKCECKLYKVEDEIVCKAGDKKKSLPVKENNFDMDDPLVLQKMPTWCMLKENVFVKSFPDGNITVSFFECGKGIYHSVITWSREGVDVEGMDVDNVVCRYVNTFENAYNEHYAHRKSILDKTSAKSIFDEMFKRNSDPSYVYDKLFETTMSAKKNYYDILSAYSVATGNARSIQEGWVPFLDKFLN
jgi:hypothetical protein